MGFFAFGCVSENFEGVLEDGFFLQPLVELLVVELLRFFGGAFGFEVCDEAHGVPSYSSLF